MKSRLVALGFLIGLACAAAGSVLVVVLATRGVLAEEQGFRDYVHHWGANFPPLRFIRPNVVHLPALNPLYGMSAAMLVLEAVAVGAIVAGRRRWANVTIPCAMLLAWAIIIALYKADTPIFSCFYYEDFGGCGAGSADAENLLNGAHRLALGAALLCSLLSLLRLPIDWRSLYRG